MSKWDQRFMNIAKEISSWSKDPSTRVGAVVVKDRRPITFGYNGLPAKIEDTHDRLNIREIKYDLTIHAEENVLFNALYHGQSVREATLYVYGLPVCHHCAPRIIQTGIKRIVMVMPEYNDPTEKWINSYESKSKPLFEEAGIEVHLAYDVEEL